MSTNKGGLGLPHPRCVAIPTLILSMKRCINYSTEGVWVGNTTQAVKLPSSITSLFANYQSSTNNQLQIFNKFAPALADICVHDSLDNRMTHFLHKSSPNTVRIHRRVSETVLNSVLQFETSTLDSNYNLLN